MLFGSTYYCVSLLEAGRFAHHVSVPSITHIKGVVTVTMTQPLMCGWVFSQVGVKAEGGGGRECLAMARSGGAALLNRAVLIPIPKE